MADFVSSDVEKIYQTISNSESLKKVLEDNYMLLIVQNYIGQYTESLYKQKVSEIDEINSENLYLLASLLNDNKDTINSLTVKLLSDNSFLRSEISDIFDNIEVTDDVLKEIFYTYKYCMVNNFFQNNRKYFLPEYDLNKIESNDKLNVFMDAILKEFDKLNSTLDSIKDAIDIDKIDATYLNYLSQLLGYEKKDVPSLNEESFRELVKNIIDIYKIKGTNYSFELFFNFLGFNIEIQEFFFDRRYYYKIGGGNPYTNDRTLTNYAHYLTTIDPKLNKIDGFSTSEIVNFSDIGSQYSLLEFNDLAETYGTDAVLGYSKLDKNNKIYTGKIYTYFKTNYIYYNIYLDDGYPTSEELVAITKYLNFLSPTFVSRTLKTSSSESITDDITLRVKEVQTGTYYNSTLDKDETIDITRQHILYNFLNKGMGQNYGKKLIFSRMFDYYDKNGNLVLEVNPYPELLTDIQDDYYETNSDYVDLTKMKEFVYNNRTEFGTVIDTVITGSPSNYLLGSASFIQDFDNTNATDINALMFTKCFSYIFKNSLKLSGLTLSNAQNIVTDSTLIFNSLDDLTASLNTDNIFRSKLIKNLKIAVKSGEYYDIYYYACDTNKLKGKYTNAIEATSALISSANLTFETLTEAIVALSTSVPFYGAKVYINSENKIYTYSISEYKNDYVIKNGYVFDTIDKARIFFNATPSLMKKNVEFYINEDNRLYKFIYKNRKIGKKVWFTDSGALYEFKEETNNENFIEVDLTGEIILNGSTYLMVHDGTYPYYDEEEDKESYIFYNHNHSGIRPNKYQIRKLYDTSNLAFVLKYYVTTYYYNLSEKEKNSIITVIDSNSNYDVNTLPEVLTNIYLGTYSTIATNDTVISAITSEIATLKNAVIVTDENGNIITPTPDDILNNYVKLIEISNLFVDYNYTNSTFINKVTDFFSDIEYVTKVTAWREKFFDDDDIGRTLTDIASDIILGDKKAKISMLKGKLSSFIDLINPGTIASFDGKNYNKVKLPFYGYSVYNNKYTFMIKESDLSPYIDIKDLINSYTSTVKNTYPNKSIKFVTPKFSTNSGAFNTYISDGISFTYDFNYPIYVTAAKKDIYNNLSYIYISTEEVTKPTIMPSVNNFSLVPVGFVYVNNFNKYLKNNKTTYFDDLNYIKKSDYTDDYEYSSFGYDNDVKIVLSKSEKTSSQAIGIFENNNTILRSSNIEGINYDIVNVSYVPNTISYGFSCGTSQVNTSDIVFKLNCGTSDAYTENNISINCGGA